MPNIQSFLEKKEKDFEREFGLDIPNLKTREEITKWLRSHDERLLGKVREMVEKLPSERMFDDVDDYTFETVRLKDVLDIISNI